MTQVFISYSRKEIRFVEKLARDLEAKGYDVWFDLTDLDGGESWAQGIQDGINASKYFVIVVSENSIKSEWVEKEYIYASSRGLKIIPVLFDDCEADLPIWLMNIQYIDMRVKRDYQENLDKIIDTFDEEDVPLPPKPPEESPLDSLLKKPATLWIGGVVILTLILLLVFWPKSPPAEPTLPETSTATATQVIPTTTWTPTPQPEITETNTPEKPTPTPTEINASTATPIPTEMIDKSGAEMVLIPSGKFWMGSNVGEQDERPLHLVELSAFYMDKFEVTNAQYLKCFYEGACDKPSNTIYFLDSTSKYADYPVVYVMWQDAVDFCEWRGARLPTEAEWEKAARGDSRFDYPWGDEKLDGRKLNFCDMNCTNSWNSKTINDKYAEIAPVGNYESGKTDSGIYDLAGNVWEWVADWYAADYYAIYDASPFPNPTGPESGLFRVLRGGSWYNAERDILVYKRYQLNFQDSGNNQVGFRCAKNIE